MARERKRATPPPKAERVRPVEGFVPATDFGTADDKPAPAPVRTRAPADDSEADELELGLPEYQPDPRDAEIERLRAELAALKGVAGSLKGGKFTISWKDGPTVTIEARPGESPADALGRYGVHSTPHKLEIHEAPADAVCGQHLPNGQIRPFAGSAEK